MPNAVSAIRKWLFFNEETGMKLVNQSASRRMSVNDTIAAFFSDALYVWNGQRPEGLNPQSYIHLSAFLHGEMGCPLVVEYHKTKVTIAKRRGGGLEVVEVSFNEPTKH